MNTTTKKTYKNMTTEELRNLRELYRKGLDILAQNGHNRDFLENVHSAEIGEITAILGQRAKGYIAQVIF